MTAQSIITNVNKSEYVTILPAPFNVSGNWYSTSSAPWVSILLSMYGFAHFWAGSRCRNFGGHLRTQNCVLLILAGQNAPSGAVFHRSLVQDWPRTVTRFLPNSAERKIALVNYIYGWRELRNATTIYCTILCTDNSVTLICISVTVIRLFCILVFWLTSRRDLVPSHVLFYWVHDTILLVL